MQLLFLNGHHLEPDVHTSNVPTCVDSFLVQGTSFTSIPPNRIACTGRSMIAWHSANAVIMCKAHKTSWREVKLQQRPHSLGQLFIKSFFVHQILMIRRLSQHRKREEAEGTLAMRSWQFRKNVTIQFTVQKSCSKTLKPNMTWGELIVSLRAYMTVQGWKMFLSFSSKQHHQLM